MKSLRAQTDQRDRRSILPSPSGKVRAGAHRESRLLAPQPGQPLGYLMPVVRQITAKSLRYAVVVRPYAPERCQACLGLAAAPRNQSARIQRVTLSPRQVHQSSTNTAPPNPSLKGSANGRPPGPGLWQSCIFTARALASCRRRPLSSNVRRQRSRFLPRHYYCGTIPTSYSYP
jgi:hypothetical protein